MAERYVVAVDGPAGSGKSTVAGLLAQELGIIHADSGAIYRTLTLALMELQEKSGAGVWSDLVANTDPRSLRIFVRMENGKQVNGIDGRSLGQEIRTRAVTEKIRSIAEEPRYRDEVNRLLRHFATASSLVIDGRDIGSVVFPDTPYKFFLDASVEVRARRRLEELGETVELTTLMQEVADRDRSDRERPIAPLVQAPDAIYIDTSSLAINAVVQRILAYLQIQF